MTDCDTDVELDFYQQRPLTVEFSNLDLSSDVGILLARQAEEQLQICQDLSACIEDWRDQSKITHSIAQLVSQRVYQLVGGYEDANDSDFLRHDPILKIVCELRSCSILYKRFLVGVLEQSQNRIQQQYLLFRECV